MVQKRIFFKNEESNKLEGIIHEPEQISRRLPAIIVLHPHPLYGGTMYNNVVEAICEGAIENNIISLRFNCRGVGNSQGENPSEENGIRDTLSAIDYLYSEVESIDKENIGFCGYSWGSKVGLEAAYNNPKIRYLIAISPPLALFSFDFLKKTRKAKYLIVGSQDQFCPIEKFNDLWKKLEEPLDHDVIDDADHFYWGYEFELKNKVFDFINELE
ncbi:MAG: alpha/beta hydrolase [Candidatus Helarchaeota archaeon]